MADRLRFKHIYTHTHTHCGTHAANGPPCNHHKCCKRRAGTYTAEKAIQLINVTQSSAAAEHMAIPSSLSGSPLFFFLFLLSPRATSPSSSSLSSPSHTSSAPSSFPPSSKTSASSSSSLAFSYLLVWIFPVGWHWSQSILKLGSAAKDTNREKELHISMFPNKA